MDAIFGPTVTSLDPAQLSDCAKQLYFPPRFWVPSVLQTQEQWMAFFVSAAMRGIFLHGE